MKKINLLSTLIIATICFAAPAFSAETKTKGKPASVATMKKEVAGKVDWAGYGPGSKKHGGTIQVKSGSSIEVKGDDVIGGTIVFDMTTLDSPDSPKLVAHLKSPDFFEVEKNPEASYKITKIEKAGAEYKLMGDLTIRGKTEPAAGTATITKDGDKMKASGKVMITDRTKYGINYNSEKFGGAAKWGDKLIKDNIDIAFDVMTK